MTFLTELHLGATQITDLGITELARVQNLTKLWLFDNRVTDASIPALMKHRKLTELYIHGTKLTKKGIERLKFALPKCQVKDQLATH